MGDRPLPETPTVLSISSTCATGDCRIKKGPREIHVEDAAHTEGSEALCSVYQEATWWVPNASRSREQSVIKYCACERLSLQKYTAG
jgi:hypothetical protein